MKISVVGLGVLALCLSGGAHAAANGDVSPAMVADKFVDALRHQRFKDAAAMFAPGATRDAGATERGLKRIDDKLGGFSTMHAIATLPDGKSVKLDIPARSDSTSKVQRFVQLRYAAVAGDGTPVFYELNLTAGDTPPKVLSFGLHLPATDAPATERAHQLVNAIER